MHYSFMGKLNYIMSAKKGSLLEKKDLDAMSQAILSKFVLPEYKFLTVTKIILLSNIFPESAPLKLKKG